MSLVLLTSTTTVLAGGAQDDEGYQRINPKGLDEIDQINDALHRWGRTFVIVGAALSGVIALKIIGPSRIYHSINDRRLTKAVRGVDDLIKRIQAEAETTTSDAKEESAGDGLLMAMAEIAEFSQGEQVPAYVLTVNDLMLDNIRYALHRLRRFEGGNADRYRNYMFSVIKGIKTITEESLRADVPSGLAVDVKDYFGDDQRYRAWEKLLRRAGRRGDHKEIAEAFLLFIRNIREGRPLVVPEKVTPSAPQVTVASVSPASGIPQVLNEETLPAVQQAAAKEAGHLVSLVRQGRAAETRAPALGAWQFEFVRRQRQIHLKEEAQKMLTVFLDCERKELPRITRTRMLPCRTWPHTLHMLGVADGPELRKRVGAASLTIQEIIIIEKAFLQTFAKKGSLEHVYGRGEEAELMMNLHIPQIRREALELLRQLAKAEPARFDRATRALNGEETPQHNEVMKLIQHYVSHQHDPPGIATEQ
jgi:hypothetical protein